MGLTAGIIIGCVAVLVLWVILGTIIGVVMTRVFTQSESKKPEFTYRTCIDQGEFTEASLAAFGFQEFSVESALGYTIRGVHAPGKDPERCVIFVHGHTWTWHGMVKYFPIYRDLGYTIIAYDHRYHGKSGGDFCSAGFFEKQDLVQVADWAFRTYPTISTFGVVGESLGAATVLQYAPMDSRLTFVHADCPYSDVTDLYRHQLRPRNVPSVLHASAMCASRWYMRLRYEFDPDQISPKADIMRTRVPILIIHGDADTYVPTWMSVEMEALRREFAPTRLVLIPGATHAKSIIVDPKGYRQAVHGFLKDFT